jgi:hypothetical protein
MALSNSAHKSLIPAPHYFGFMANAIDYSGWRPTVEQLKAADVAIVIRYLAPLPNGKVIDAAELKRYIDAGIAVVFVWELSEYTWQGGFGLGETHGREARRQLHALGVPDSVPVLAAYDSNIQPFQLANAREYQRGFAKWCGATGVYGTAFVIADFFAHGIASFAMQTNARGWYGNHDDSPHAGLIQRYGKSIAGLVPVQYDVNTIVAHDVGQYPRPAAPQPVPEPIVTEDDMKGLGLAHHSNGTVSVTNLLTRRKLADVAEQKRVCAIYHAVTGEDIPYFALTDEDIESIPDARVVPNPAPAPPKK